MPERPLKAMAAGAYHAPSHQWALLLPPSVPSALLKATTDNAQELLVQISNFLG